SRPPGCRSRNCTRACCRANPARHRNLERKGERMNIAHSFRARVGILLGALALMSLAAIPLIGTAQDTRPSGQLSEEWRLSEGEHIWNTVCIACHQPAGKGIEGIYLPLNGSPLVTTEDPTYLVSTILTGRGGMPRF